MSILKIMDEKHLELKMRTSEDERLRHESLIFLFKMWSIDQQHVGMIWELDRNAESQACPLSEPRNQNLHFSKIPKWSICIFSV